MQKEIAEKQKVLANENRTKDALKMSNYNEQYSRKTNIKIVDVSEEREETEARLTEKVDVILKALGVELGKSEILAIHRIPTSGYGPRPVLIKAIHNSV
ncbi:hypothetical protein MAR_026100 [Mya arenaria]|uniref:Uncharacterized protein n=1 Tax=Mya arenaria TaxID=6604 RepID=A0ABY7ERN7_MYAAR|nr:hypothetical protein MAR_026100 [Mya arenaria]